MVVAWIIVGKVSNEMGMTFEFGHTLEPGCVRKPYKVREAVDAVTRAVDTNSLLRSETIEWSWRPYRRAHT
jgi:hypothetical protein